MRAKRLRLLAARPSHPGVGREKVTFLEWSCTILLAINVMAPETLTTLDEKSRQQPGSREFGEESVRSYGQLQPILQLQRTLGNRRVAELIQAKRLSPQGRLFPLQPGSIVGEIQRSPDPDAGGSGLVSQRMSPIVRLETALQGSFTIDSFTNGKSDVSPTNRELLTTAANTILSLLDKYPASTVRVVGHTDSVGKEEANQVLGQERANSVQAFLVKAGIPAEAIRSESRGRTDPAVNTRKAEPRNRRVEVRFEPSSLLANSLPGVSLGNGSQDNPGPGVLHLPTDGDLPAPGLMTGDPAGISADKRWPKAPPEPHKPGKFDRYGAGKPDDQPGVPEAPDLGGAQGTVLSPTPDLLGAGRVWEDVFPKDEGPATKAP